MPRRRAGSVAVRSPRGAHLPRKLSMRSLPTRRSSASLVLAVLVACVLVLLPTSSASAVVTQGISGRVTGAGGTPLSDVYVFFLEDSSNGGAQYGPVQTDATGNYSIQLDPGSYWVGFYDASGQYAEQYWKDARRFADGVAVAVQSSTVTQGIDAQLELAGSISGTVTLPAGADLNSDDSDVDVVDPVSGETVGGTWFDSSDETAPGSNTYTYTVGGLPAGTYRVEFAREDYQATVEGQYFAGHPESDGRSSADTVTVTSGADRPGVDATLHTGGTISGTLVDGTGAPVADCEVVAFNNVDHYTLRFGTTGADGSFVVTGLTSGRYGLRVGDLYNRGNGCGTTEFYTRPDGDLSTTATGLIAVSATPGQDVALAHPLVYGTPDITSSTPPAVPGAAPVVGTPVTASAGTWNPTDVNLSYQWRANGSPLAGATAASYTPVAADLGKSLSVVVTATKPGYGAAMSTSNGTAPVTQASGGPVITNAAVPGVSGVARVGQELSAYAGSWSTASGAPTTSLQWLRDGVAVPGATATTYRLRVADLGARISVRVTATKDGYPAAQRTSGQTNPVAPGTFTVTDAPRVLGMLKVGRALRAVAPTCDPTATSVRLQWLRNGVAIKGAAAKRARYVLTRADRGKRISVRVTLLRPGYASTTSVARKVGRVR